MGGIIIQKNGLKNKNQFNSAEKIGHIPYLYYII